MKIQKYGNKININDKYTTTSQRIDVTNLGNDVVELTIDLLKTGYVNFRADVADIKINGRQVTSYQNFVTKLFSADPDISYLHDAVHRAGYVTASYFNPADDLADGQFQYFLIASGEQELHSAIKVGSAGASNVWLTIDPVASGGTAINHVNNNLYLPLSATTPTTFVNPTVQSSGTTLFTTRIFASSSGAQSQQLGGTSRNEEEWVIPAGKKMLVVIESDANNNEVYFNHEYYIVPAGTWGLNE